MSSDPKWNISANTSAHNSAEGISFQNPDSSEEAFDDLLVDQLGYEKVAAALNADVDQMWGAFATENMGGVREDKGRGVDAVRGSFSGGVLGRWSSLWHLAWIVPITIIGIKNFPTAKQQPATQSKTYATAAGQRASFELPDGSHVILAPRSRLELTSPRRLSLQGEAYFEVNASSDNPFTVQTQRSFVQVLGTAFSVRAITGEEFERLVVASGKISFSNAGSRNSAEVLTGASVAQLSRDGKIEVTRGANTGDLLGWTDGRLVFRNVSASKMLDELSRWYAVDMSIVDPQNTVTTVTATFSTDEPLHRVIETIGYMLGAAPKRQGSSITFVKPIK